LRRQKFLFLALILLILVAGYSLFVVVKAYIETPAIISSALASNKMTLRLEDFSEEHLNDLLAVEDPGFYSHHGVDVWTPGAGYTTITQGLVKQLYFEHFTPGLSKLKQTLIALVLDRRVDKKTQLLLFINSVYLGNVNGRDVNGFGDGAQVYFGKNFSELTRDEYLSLVAMIVAPNEYNVMKQPEQNSERVRRIKRLLAGECKPLGFRDVYYEGCKTTAP